MAGEMDTTGEPGDALPAESPPPRAWTAEAAMEPVPPLAPPPRRPSDDVPAVVERGPGPGTAFRGLATRLIVVGVLLGLLVILLTLAGR